MTFPCTFWVGVFWAFLEFLQLEVPAMRPNKAKINNNFFMINLRFGLIKKMNYGLTRLVIKGLKRVQKKIVFI